jgi:DNA-binding LytR/AlgR family response regulator
MQIEMYAKIGDIEQSAPDYFVRCHQSYLVNSRHVKKIGKTEVELANGKKVPISQRRRRELLKSMKSMVDESFTIK